MRTKLILLGSGVIYLLLYFIYYPRIYGIIDEACYIDLAYALRKGTVYLEQADLGTIHFPIKVGSHVVSMYPVGNATLLMPFTILGVYSLFLYGLIFHLIGYMIFIKVLKQVDINPKYAVLYLFYPPQLLFSRTVMSDLPAAVFILLAFYLYQRERYLFSGMALGLSFIIRYAGIVLVPVFLVFALIRRRAEGLKMLIGLLPFLLLVLFYNYVVYGGILRTGYSAQLFPVDLHINIHRCARHFLAYVLALSIFYPLMIVSPFLYKGKYRYEIFTSFVVIVLFYILFSYTFTIYHIPCVKSCIKTLFLTVRYFFPIIPMLLIAYSSICTRYLNKTGFTIVLGLLITIATGIHYYHHKYLNSQVKFRDSLYSHTTESSFIISNLEATELVSPLWGKRTLLLLEDIDISSLSTYLQEDTSGEGIWLAILIRQDKPTPRLMEPLESLTTRFDTQLVKELTRRDKEFKLFKIFLLSHNPLNCTERYPIINAK